MNVFTQTRVKDAGTAMSSADDYMIGHQGTVVGNYVDDPEMRHLNLRSDDPSFDVADSVQCTRCTSTQSLTSLLPVSSLFILQKYEVGRQSKHSYYSKDENAVAI